jgi:hypothetical protein
MVLENIKERFLLKKIPPAAGGSRLPFGSIALIHQNPEEKLLFLFALLDFAVKVGLQAAGRKSNRQKRTC